MGGTTSLLAVGERRIDASALVLVDIAPDVNREGVARIKAFMSHRPEGFDSLEEVAAAIAAYQPHRKPPTNLEGLAKIVRLGDDGRYHWHWDPKCRLQRSDPVARRKRMIDAAASLRLPTLLVRGGLSDVVTEEGAREFRELCPHAEYISVGGAGHMIAGGRNDIFGKAVIEFLARVAR
jgi:non-heme chloroperoxidase